LTKSDDLASFAFELTGLISFLYSLTPSLSGPSDPPSQDPQTLPLRTLRPSLSGPSLSGPSDPPSQDPQTLPLRTLRPSFSGLVSAPSETHCSLSFNLPTKQQGTLH